MDTYKRFVMIWIVVVLLFVILIHPTIFFINLNKKNLIEQYLDEWLDKKEQYSIEHENKIVILSGSNTIFGVDTERMEKELEIPVLNAGTHAGLHEYIFYWAKNKILKDGDIVIMPLEYEQYESNFYAEEYLNYIWGYAGDYFNSLGLYDKLKIIYKTSPKSLLRNMKDLIMHKIPAKNTNSKYSSKDLNYNGDMTNNKVENKMTNEDLKKTIQEKVFIEDKVPGNKSKKEIENFANYCKEHNIKIYATWPAYLYDKKEFSNSDIEKIENIIKYYENQGIKVLGNYSDTIYDIDLFYDTYYHLNDKGKKIHTDYLMNLIKKEGLK